MTLNLHVRHLFLLVYSVSYVGIRVDPLEVSSVTLFGAENRDRLEGSCSTLVQELQTVLEVTDAADCDRHFFNSLLQTVLTCLIALFSILCTNSVAVNLLSLATSSYLQIVGIPEFCRNSAKNIIVKESSIIAHRN